MNGKCSSFFDIFTRSLSNIKKTNEKRKIVLLFIFFKLNFLSCSHRILKKRIILCVHTVSWRIWICYQIFKIFILKFSFLYTFCQFYCLRTEPRIFKIVFFFSQHDSRWTLQQYGTVICFLVAKVLEIMGLLFLDFFPFSFDISLVICLFVSYFSFSIFFPSLSIFLI